MIETNIRWHPCAICGYHYKVIKSMKTQDLKYRHSSTRGCLVCAYRDTKLSRYNTLLKNFELEDEKQFLFALKSTMWYMYRELGPIQAEDVFYRAMNTYWRPKKE